MEATKYLSLAALALMGTLASCQSDDEAAASFARPDNAVGINVSVGSLKGTTRSNPAATDDTQREFNQGDQISVSTDGQDPVLFQCQNADMQTWAEAEAGKFLLWTQSEMTFQAYYPATTGTSMTAFNLPADQSSEAKIALADYMTRQKTCNNENGTDITLDLERKTARVIVRINSFTDQYDNDEKTVSNVRINSQYSAIANDNGNGDVTAVTPYQDGTGGLNTTYTALVVPGSGDDGADFITLTDALNNTLRVKGIPELEAGNSYTYNLTVGKNRILVQSVTVQNWATGETLAGGQATEASSVTEVTSFSELQTALSAGKNVKLMDNIDCTAEISITSNGALTIDGNGKKLSTTSEIRAFKVGSSATVAFKNLTLTGFVSGGGPAINNSGTIVLDGCTISNCHVSNNNGGGAIENKSGGKLYAINTTFSGNYSGEIGGAINNYNSSLYMSGCTFTNNYTTRSDAYYGGAIGINGGSEVRLINCAFSGNQYGTNAGPSDIGVYSKPTNYTIAGCTGATIASRVGDITTNTTGTATLDYSDLSNISFTYTSIINLSTLTGGYEAQDGETLTGTLTNNVQICIADGATVTLKDVNITNLGDGDDCNWAGITCLGDATLVLEGTNEVCAGRDGYGDNYYPGIYIAPGKTLTIQGDGTLTAYSDADSPYAAGIGGGDDIACGHIVINSGNITAMGGESAAGIGGRDASCGNITIYGGTVTATGGQYAAGIGSGYKASCGKITIYGGTVTATGGQYAAGIGTGYTKEGVAISCDNITINGGTVTATGGQFAAGIGSGYNGGGGASCGNITINGGTVTATGAYRAAGIGSGEYASCGNITISGGTVTATAGNGVQSQSVIGVGSEGTCSKVTITTGITSLTMTSGNGAGIVSDFIKATAVYANSTDITSMLSTSVTDATVTTGMTAAGFATSYNEGTKTWTVTKK